MTFDLSLLQNAIQIIRQLSPGRPDSVRPTALQMHEILGGQVGNTTPIIRRGYFAVWAAGGLLTPIPAGGTGKGKPNEPVTPPPSIKVQSPTGPIVGFPVRFRVTKGGGLLDTDRTVVEKLTNAEGVAAVSSWTLGPDNGLNEVVAEGFSLNQSFKVNAV